MDQVAGDACLEEFRVGEEGRPILVPVKFGTVLQAPVEVDGEQRFEGPAAILLLRFRVSGLEERPLRRGGLAVEARPPQASDAESGRLMLAKRDLSVIVSNEPGAL